MTEHQPREKFATQMHSAMLAELRALAKSEGRQLQSLIEEAVSKLLETRQTSEPDFEALMKRNHDRYASVFEKLAK
ncbi:hypothetical protein [Asticcacaulis taihuensis]|uniref:hypothetical protein n=1 Tax=Asticcacaulis taihuensis TaxID=260084 RepID=UPI003F7B97CE